MYIRNLNQLIFKIATKVLCCFQKGIGKEITYGNQDLIVDFQTEFNHKVIYGFFLQKGKKSAIVYIGKSEDNSRIRQHLTGRNRNGSPLAKSVNTKYCEILKAIQQGFTVKLCLFTDPDLDKASLSSIEIAMIIESKKYFKNIFPNEKHWNQRV